MKRALPLFAAAALLAASQPAWSSDDAKLVSYRSVIMESLARHMKATSMILKGEVNRPADLVAHATALHDVSNMIPDLYPQGTGPDKHKTGAKAEIWEKWEDFLKVNTAFQEESAKLVEVAKGGDVKAVGAQFRNVGKQCGECHDAFRVDD